ncbi:signal recognition particle-docking protein FtsY [Blattabacterium cuenoti]|uniref:signal recognition particle-docking protein FtsY n=1 Tax=Blattabacterium cuenoti TaxID=1653831 RepID=UPI00163BD445|nr:signal recognition particle-docking protein FtsY [Blattabacterium cuenoti]
MKGNTFFSKIKNFFSKKYEIRIQDIDEIENLLLSSDIGTKTTIEIINSLEEKIKKNQGNSKNLYEFLKDEIQNVFSNIHNECLSISIKKNKKPFVILIVGVNGVGKTTTVGKLAFFFKKKGFSSIIGASDTFREAAIEQLEIWANRANVPIVKQQLRSDPASVAYDTVQSAISKNIDVAIIDTAGRLHNRVSLMNELSKIRRVIKKILGYHPNETILILDGTIGQNALEQVRKFLDFVKISSIILTKMEGTAKGGIIISISNSYKLPIRYMGLGEKIEDLKIFDQEKFINSLFKKL